jgi:hypothetical protein
MKDNYIFMNWHDTYPAEMKAFIACIIISGIYRLPEIKDHWGPHRLIRSNVSLYITRERWMSLHRFFRVNSEDDICEENPVLTLVKPLLKIPKNWQKYYNPS